MKEGRSITSHPNEFNIIFSQLQAHKLNFDMEMKAIFILCSLPSSWDTFHTSISNSALGEMLNFDDVVGSLLAKEIMKKSMDHGNKHDTALNVDRRRRQFKGKSKERGSSHSKSCSHKNLECHQCGEQGHIKHDCHEWKREQKGKRQDANVCSHKEEPQKTKSSMKIEEINTITNDSDDDILHVAMYKVAYHFR